MVEVFPFDTKKFYARFHDSPTLLCMVSIYHPLWACGVTRVARRLVKLDRCDWIDVTNIHELLVLFHGMFR